MAAKQPCQARYWESKDLAYLYVIHTNSPPIRSPVADTDISAPQSSRVLLAGAGVRKALPPQRASEKHSGELHGYMRSFRQINHRDGICFHENNFNHSFVQS